jgi:hypothetical protein
VLSIFPEADISVSVVWINMLPSDNADTAKQSALIVDDDRARHFYDPERRVGQAVALSLGEPGMIAWDIYLFYAAGQEWLASMPAPTHWAHQLSGERWHDHFHWGDDLHAELHRAMRELTDTEGRQMA